MGLFHSTSDFCSVKCDGDRTVKPANDWALNEQPKSYLLRGQWVVMSMKNALSIELIMKGQLLAYSTPIYNSPSGLVWGQKFFWNFWPYEETRGAEWHVRERTAKLRKIRSTSMSRKFETHPRFNRKTKTALTLLKVFNTAHQVFPFPFSNRSNTGFGSASRKGANAIAHLFAQRRKVYSLSWHFPKETRNAVSCWSSSWCNSLDEIMRII